MRHSFSRSALLALVLLSLGAAEGLQAQTRPASRRDKATEEEDPGQVRIKDFHVPLYPGAKASPKLAESYREQNDVELVKAFTSQAPYAKVVKFYQSIMSAKATFESEGPSLYMAGAGTFEIRVAKAGKHGAHIYMCLKAGAPPAGKGEVKTSANQPSTNPPSTDMPSTDQPQGAPAAEQLLRQMGIEPPPGMGTGPNQPGNQEGGAPGPDMTPPGGAGQPNP